MCVPVCWTCPSSRVCHLGRSNTNRQLDHINDLHSVTEVLLQTSPGFVQNPNSVYVSEFCKVYNFGYDTHELACGMAELELFWGLDMFTISIEREREREAEQTTLKWLPWTQAASQLEVGRRKLIWSIAFWTVPCQSAQDRNGKTTPDYHSLWANNPQMICTPLAMSDMLIGAEKGVRRRAVQIRGKFVKAWSRCETPTAKSKTDTTTLLRLIKTSTHLGYTTDNPPFLFLTCIIFNFYLYLNIFQHIWLTSFSIWLHHQARHRGSWSSLSDAREVGCGLTSLDCCTLVGCIHWKGGTSDA